VGSSAISSLVGLSASSEVALVVVAAGWYAGGGEAGGAQDAGVTEDENGSRDPFVSCGVSGLIGTWFW
jgi:hypothetical protein